MEATHLTLRDREEVAHTGGLLAGMADLVTALSPADLNREALAQALREADGTLARLLDRDLRRRVGDLTEDRCDG